MSFIVKGIKNAAEDVVDFVGDTVKEGIDGITDIQNEVNAEFKDLIDSGAINDLVASSVNLATQPIGAGIGGAGTAFGAAAQNIGSGVGVGMAAGLQGGFSGLFSGLGGAFGLSGSTFGFIVFGVGAVIIVLLIVFALQ